MIASRARAEASCASGLNRGGELLLLSAVAVVEADRGVTDPSGRAWGGDEGVGDGGGDGGRDGGGGGSGTTWVFARGPAGESPAEGDARECFFACASDRSDCIGVRGCSSATCGAGDGGSGGGVDGRGSPGGSSGGGGCAGVDGVAARLQRRMMDCARKARALSISSLCADARAFERRLRADGVAVASPFSLG